MNQRQLGGIGFLIGNGALFANGLIAHMHAPTKDSREAGMNRMVSAGLWSGAGVILTKYGQRPVNRQLERLEEKLASFLQEQGVPLDAESLRKADAQTQRGWFAKLEDFMYAHPIECTNGFIGLAGLGMLSSGALKYREGDRTNAVANLIDGAVVILGALATILIPEKTPERIAAEGKTGTIWGKVQQKPLEYLFYPHLAGDLTTGVQAWSEYKTAAAPLTSSAFRPWAYAMSATSVLTTAGFVAENALTGFGSKKASGKPEEHEAAQAALMRSAAQMLANQPPVLQEALARQAAIYLVHQEGLRMSDRNPKEIADGIVAAMHHEAPLAPIATVGGHTEKLARAATTSLSSNVSIG